MMAAQTTPATCPTCGSTRIRRHCGKGHPSCNWYVCARCTSFGVLGGKWHDKRTGKTT